MKRLRIFFAVIGFFFLAGCGSDGTTDQEQTIIDVESKPSIGGAAEAVADASDAAGEAIDSVSTALDPSVPAAGKPAIVPAGVLSRKLERGMFDLHCDDPARIRLDTVNDLLILVFDQCLKQNVSIKVGKKQVSVDLYRDGRAVAQRDLSGGRISRRFEPFHHSQGFIFRATLPGSGGTVFETVRKGEVAISALVLSDCGVSGRRQPATYTAFRRGTFSEKFDRNLDGILEIDRTQSFPLPGFEMKVTNGTFQQCFPQSHEVVFNGAVSVEDHLRPVRNFNRRYEDFMLTMTGVVNPDPGRFLDVKGTVRSFSPCASQGTTLTMTTPIPLFIPVGESCPVEGQLDLAGDLTGTMTFGADEIVVREEGVERRYESCPEAKGCLRP
ncbi:MAG: hypothetical protein WAO55_00530 [Candidatus Manganitrophaceae bacterium]